jgi:putative component of toxin-antitoxin plasmid stabilization module
MPSETVIYFETPSGRQPIVEFLDGLDRISKGAREKCIARIDQLAEGMLLPNSPYYSKVRSAIWELRVRHVGEQYRFLCAQEGGITFVLLGIHKKTQKLDNADIDRAEANLDTLRGRRR